MSTSKEVWTIAHDLALVYIALAYGADHDLRDEELQAITGALAAWERHVDSDEPRVGEIVLEALAVYVEKEADEEITCAIATLADRLSVAQRQQALRDVVRIAEADGVLLSSEQSLITALADAWNVKAIERHLLDRTTAEVEVVQAWSLLHDLSLVYVIVAHSSDEELTEPEIQAIVERIGAWQPALDVDEARRVLGDVLQFYASEPDEEALGRSISAIKQALPDIQRLVVLDDLHHIALADGVLGDGAQQVIGMLAEAWDMPVRLNGRA